MCFWVMRDVVKAATFEHHEMGEPSVIFPVLQKITVNVHMSAHRPACQRASCCTNSVGPVLLRSLVVCLWSETKADPPQDFIIDMRL